MFSLLTRNIDDTLSYVFCTAFQNFWVKYFIKMLDFVFASELNSFYTCCDWWCYKINKTLHMIKKIIESIYFENWNDLSNSSFQKNKICIIHDRVIIKINCTTTYNHYFMHNAFFKICRFFSCKMKHFIHEYEVHTIVIWMYRQSQTLIICDVTKVIFWWLSWCRQARMIYFEI